MSKIKWFYAFQTYEGLVFTLMFFIMFSLTHLVMIDFLNMRELITSQNPLMIVILMIILTYLIKNSKIKISKRKMWFLYLWGTYLLFIVLSMLINDNFFIDEIIMWLLLTVMLLYQFHFNLMLFIIAGAFGSLPILLLSDITLNESGVTALLIFVTGLLFLPKTNQALLLYMLPTAAFLFTVTTSRTAIFLYFFLMIIYLCYINLVINEAGKGLKIVGIIFGAILIGIVLFFQKIYRFFTVDSLTYQGIDIYELTSTRSNVWFQVVDDSTIFGHGISYLDYSLLLHAHNIFIDTLGRYGIITLILFIMVMVSAIIIGFAANQLPVIGIYMLIYALVGMTEYNYLFLFDYSTPIILFFVFLSYSLSKLDDESSNKVRLSIPI